MSGKVDLEALRDIGHAITGRQVVIDIDTYRIILAALERAERIEKAARRWEDHRPSCSHDPDRRMPCTCGYEELAAALESEP